MNKLLTGLFCSIFIVCSVGAAAQIVVTPGDSQGWVGRSSNTGTIGVGVADDQGGNASLEMATDGSPGQIVKVARVPLINVEDITSISYRLNTNTVSGFFPVPQLEYLSLSQDRSGTLVYLETNTTIPANAWDSVVVDPNADLWFSTEYGVGDQRTLSQWQADLPDVLMNFFQIGFGDTGGSFPVTTANLDYIELNGTVWDFEDATIPPEPPPTPEFVTVDPTNQQGWFGKAGNTGSGGLSTNEPRAGNGSLELITDGSLGQIVNVARVPITTVDAIAGVSWEFNSSGAADIQIPVAKIEYFSLARSGTLVYVWGGAPYTPGTWQSVDGVSGTWYSTEPGFGLGDQRTLAEWQEELSGILVNFFSVGMGSTGGSFPATTAYVDTVRLATSREDVTWNFEGTAPLPPQPALTTTTITSTGPNPSNVGQAVTISYQVEVVAPDVGTPTGTVTVSDTLTRAVLCSSSVAAGSCSASFAVAGSVGLVASFTSDVTDYANSVSDTYVHSVVDDTAGPTPPPGGSAPVPAPLPVWMLVLLSVLMVSVVHRAGRKSS